MRNEHQQSEAPSAFNGPAPLYESLAGLMQQNLDLSRDLMRRSLASMEKLAGLPEATLGRIEPFRAPASAWSEFNQRGIEMMQKMAERRMDTIEQWTRMGLELLDQAMPRHPQPPQTPDVTASAVVTARPRRAA